MKKLLSFLSLLVLSFAGSVAALDTWLEGENTIAGQNIPVNISGLLSEEVVGLDIQRPGGTDISLSLVANKHGNASTSIAGLHTHKVGTYNLGLKREFGTDLYDSVTVFPGEASPYRSTVVFEEQTAPADGESLLFFTVKAIDAYGNPVENAAVRVISSRNNDIVAIPGKTNASGIASGKIFSDTPGISILSVLLDNEVLSDKPEVVFHLSDSSGLSVGQGLGQFLRAQVFEDEPNLSELSGFEIQGNVSEVEIGSPLTVTVIAKDQNGDPFLDYDGTIRFVSSDNKAEPPADYTFSSDDQGSHTFFLAVTFGTPGEQTFSVHDVNQLEKKGTVAVRVVSGDAIVVPGTPVETGSITVLSPENDTLYRASRLTISGQAPGLSAVKVRFGQTNVVESALRVEEDGSFVYQTPTLNDGIYEFTILSQDELTSSPTIRVTIDRTAPSSMAVNVSPEGAKKPNEIFTLELNSGEELDSAQCVFNEFAYDLLPQGDSVYSIDVSAPPVCGEYPVGCSVSDAVGNKLEESNAAVVSVSCEELPDLPQNSAPTAPTNVTGKPGDGIVTLFWSPALDDGSVQSYQVSYVEDGSTEIMSNRVPDNRTQWYIDGLEACSQYKFTVTALDNQGLESVPSEIVNQGPICDKPTHSSAPKTTDSGGEFPWVIVLISLLVGGSVVSLVRKS